MNPHDGEQTQILRDIWKQMGELQRTLREEIRKVGAGIGQTNERLDQTNERLDQTNERLDQTNERLDQTNQRLGQTNERLVSFAAATQRNFDTVDANVRTIVRAMGQRDSRMTDLESRLQRVEVHVGLRTAE